MIARLGKRRSSAPDASKETETMTIAPSQGPWHQRRPLRRARVALALVASLLLFALFTTTASAHWASPTNVDGAGEHPLSVAVDQSNGDTYVGNAGGHGIWQFDASHTQISNFGSGSRWFSGVAVNPQNHDVYAVDLVERAIQTYDPGTGAMVSSFTDESAANAGAGSLLMVQIAADAEGNVYVPNAPHNEVQVFDSEGNAPAGGVAATIAGVGEHALKAPTGVAVDPQGHVWVADDGNNRLEEFRPNGEFIKEIEGAEGVMAVATDAKGDVFASLEPESGAHVLEFNSSGAQIDDFGLGTIGETRFSEENNLIDNAIAIDAANGIFYVANDQAHSVSAFTAIGAETRPATDVTTTRATLVGAVNPQEAPVTSCEFEYGEPNGPAGVYNRTVACEHTPGPVGEHVPVSAKISGLELDDTYHYRLHVANEEGHANGHDTSFIAIEPLFGFQLGGPHALGMFVSNSADPTEPAAANPADLDTQAGSHPFDVTTRFVINTESNGNLPTNLEAKDYYVNIPAGFAGSVASIPRCKMSDLSSLDGRQKAPGCPTASQVGVIRLIEGLGQRPETEILPVYNMVPPPGVPAELAFSFVFIGQPVVFQLRSDGDYGITAKVRNLVSFVPVLGSQLTLWGVPADPAHDMERFLPEEGAANHLGGGVPGNAQGGPLPAGTPEVPFLTNPTQCGEQGEATVTADAWRHPGKLGPNGLPIPGGEGWVTANTPMFPNGITGCNKLIFQPKLTARPTTNLADSPSGLHVDLHVPQNEEPGKLATPSLKDATVTLPKGITVNPSQAAGLGACSATQIGLLSKAGQTPAHMTNAPANCPDAAKLGTVEVDTPLLPNPLKGSVYLAKPYENPFESLLAIYIVVEGEGVVVKLAGQVELNPETGQLTTTFKENPQLPFEDFKLDFFGGARAPLRTPAVCGLYETTSSLTPYSAPESGPPATPADPYEITQGANGSACPPTETEEPNSPSFEAGTESPLAGTFSPFVLHLHREDGSQAFRALNVTPPPGLLAKLAGTTYCPQAALEAAQGKSGTEEKANPSCPASSEVGTVTVGAGAGPQPYYVQGRAYLTGPYKGAPLSLAIVTPALAGPYDLGTVVVRSALYVNPETAQITVKSDPIPTALQGIPLDVRTIAVKIDRQSFTLNPTNCEALSTQGAEISVLGQVAPLTDHFQVGGCRSLKFKPKLTLSLKGKTRRAGHPALKAVLTMRPGEANIARAQVTLPHSEFLDQGHIGTVCTRVQFQEGNTPGEKCPPASIYGHARAITPLLEAPVEGPVYLRSSSHKLPDLVAALNGQIDVALDGTIDSVHGGIRNRFEVVPDAPVSRFTLEMQGGRKGLLVNSTNVCASTNRASADFTAQNGKVSDTEPVVKARCGRHRKRKARRHH